MNILLILGFLAAASTGLMADKCDIDLSGLGTGGDTAPSGE